MTDFTLESIAGVFFGDYATSEFMEDMKRFLPSIASGLFSIPIRFPWPLSKFPAFGYGRSMEARDAFASDVLNVLQERRADLASVEERGSGGKSAGLLDSLILTQQDQGFGDDFIVDNVRTVEHKALISVAVFLRSGHDKWCRLCSSLSTCIFPSSVVQLLSSRTL